MNLGCLTKQERGVRSFWLALLITNQLYALTSLPLSIARCSELLPWAWILPWIFYLLQWGIVYLIYRCAYRRPGTKWLTFGLIVGPLGLAAAIFMIAKGIYPRSAFWTALDMIISLLCLILNFKLRVINKKIKAALALAIQ
jgi:hypothetical protein